MSLVPGIGMLLIALREHRARRARRLRRHARERMLPALSFGREVLGELTRLVDEIEIHAPELARRLDLETLLDRHVALTIGHERALRALGMADRTQLERMRDGLITDPRTNLLRLELCERRLECHLACQRTAIWFSDELAIVSDLIRLIAQRVACPDHLDGEEWIQRPLAELDDDDDVQRMLEAGEIGI